MEVFVLNVILASILIWLLIKKVRRDSANKPRSWDDDSGR